MNKLHTSHMRHMSQMSHHRLHQSTNKHIAKSNFGQVQDENSAFEAEGEVPQEFGG